ncbi:MAG: class I SAM-dependent methyltransferase [Candidatus Krumholzibacteria bacterium]|nr:class I SAM-dependent methyltransferase [Candidatus Krumholzibacteria bacterium]
MSGMTGLARWTNKAMVWEPFEPTRNLIDELKATSSEKDRLFLDHGFDRHAVTDFVLDSVEPIRGPVLDIGTGKGLAAIGVAKRGHKVVTLDPDEEQIKTAITNTVGEDLASMIEFHIADVNDLPFEDESFNLAIMVDVIHHLENADNLLSEVSRVLVHGGRFVFCDFTDEGFAILDRIHGDDGHSHATMEGETVDGLVHGLHNHGLRCVSRDTRFHQYLVIAEKVG